MTPLQRRQQARSAVPTTTPLQLRHQKMKLKTFSQWKHPRACATDAPPFELIGKVPTVAAGEPTAAVGDYLSQYGPIRCPVLFEGLNRDWAALELWSDRYLEQQLPRVEVAISKSGCFPDWSCEAEGYQREEMSFMEFSQRVSTQPHAHYIHGHPLLEGDALRADCPAPAMLEGEIIGRVSFWACGTACTPVHYDLPQVLLCQVRGTKRVWLFSPEMHDALYPRGSCFPELGPKGRQGRVDVFHPNLEEFPELCRLRGLESVELNPGDALLIPCGWWHEIESCADERSELSVMVGYNWPAVGDAVGQLAALKHLTNYRILTQGEVLAQFEDQHPGVLVAPIPEELRHTPVF